MDELKKVSFVIRTLNEGKTLEEVLKRIHLIEGQYDIEIIIVDSGSTDNTLQIGKHYGARIVTISKEKWSWGISLNSGIQNSNGSFIAAISGHCFITRKDFLNNSIPILENPKIAAIYGKQISIPNMDPFEEYELYNWYPDLDSYIMNCNTLKNGKGIGISNACCVLKKEAWLKMKFDENVESFEDLIWAFDITNLGYQLVYSNRFSVYHSHALNLEYIYRKWYWRNYEKLKLDSKFLINFDRKIKFSIKRIFKSLILKEYLFFKALIEKRQIKALVNKYSFVNNKHIDTYLKLRNKALLNSFFDFYSDSKTNYWLLPIPNDVAILQNQLLEMEKFLSKDFNLLTSLN